MPTRNRSELELTPALAGHTTIDHDALDLEWIADIRQQMEPQLTEDRAFIYDDISTDWEYIQNGEGQIPEPLKPLAYDLTDAFPAIPLGRVSLARIRIFKPRELSSMDIESSLHTDFLRDYRAVAILEEEGEWLEVDGKTGEHTTTPIRPGTVISLNNDVDEKRRPQHKALYGPNGMEMFVFGKMHIRPRISTLDL